MFVAEEKKHKSTTDFSQMTDEQIVAEVHDHSDPAAQKYLLLKYKKLVYNNIRIQLIQEFHEDKNHDDERHYSKNGERYRGMH